LLVAGGLVSAFGAASCCAIPLLLGSLGLASAWLGSLALLAGPYRPVLPPLSCAWSRGAGYCSGVAGRRGMRAGDGLRSIGAVHFRASHWCRPDRARVRLCMRHA
jgi:mercuric ion transport protein